MSNHPALFFDGGRRRAAGVIGAWTLTLCAPVAGAPVVIRPEDQRVAEVSYRLATAGVARCPRTVPTLGLVLQHLGQFALPDRPIAMRDHALDRGPGVLAVVPGGPADKAGLNAGDVLLAVDGVPVPPEEGQDRPFRQEAARARTDAVDDLLDRAAARGPVSLTVLRQGTELASTVAPRPACPLRVHLARSRQLNAFADGTHVFLTTRLLERAPTDDALAFVIAHEMAHNVLGHAALMRAVPAGAGKAALTRRLERDADLLGTDLMLDAGFTTDGAATLLRATDQGPLSAWFGNHDGAGARAAAIAAHAEARRAATRP